MPPSELPLHATATASLEVGPSHLASTLASEPGEFFLPVASTPTVIGLLELAAARVLLPLLAPGETSVGAGLEVAHTAPTLEGGRLAATARYLGREGRLHRFEVVCIDGAGEVARGIHLRAIVDAARFLDRARIRGGLPA